MPNRPARTTRRAGRGSPAARPGVERLEDRLAPAALLLDQSLGYTAGTARLPLLTRADEVTVALKPGRADALAALTGPAGPLAGMQVERVLGPTVAVLIDPQMTTADPGLLAQRLAAADAVDGVADALPSYVDPDSGGWVTPTGEVVVALRPGADPGAVFADPRFAGWRRLDGTPDEYRVTVAAGGSPLADGDQLGADPRVAWAVPDFYRDSRPFSTPNDPLLPQQWHLANTGQFGGLPGADAGVVNAWGVTTGSSSVTVAVIDDGVQLDHPDLAANIWTNPGEAAGGTDNDGNGWPGDVNGWDFYNAAPESTAFPADSHGTAVAGVIAAVGNNAVGGAGVAYGVRVMPVRVGQAGVYASDADIASAIYYAAGRTRDGLGTWHAADVLNISFGGSGASSAVQAALQWATTQGRGGKGAITFVATGNDFAGSLAFPASLSATLPGVVAVGASTDQDVRAGYSNYGTGLEFLAPSGGGNFGVVTADLMGAAGYNTAPGAAGDYTDTSASAFGGTSAASPVAAGIAALILSLDPSLTAPQVRGLMRNTTDYIGPQSVTYDPVTGYNAQYGYGRVDAFTAVSGVGKIEIQVLDGRTDIPDNTGSVDFGSAPLTGGAAKVFRIRNQGTLPLTLGSINLTGPFQLVQGFGSTTLKVGETTTFVVRFMPTAPGPATGQVGFATNDADESPFTFTLTGTGFGPSISGAAYEDFDASGFRSAGEPPLAGRQVYLDLNGNGGYDPGEPSTVTDANGFYAFNGLSPGAYVVAQVLPSGWSFTSPTSGAYTVPVGPAGSVTGRDFGQVQGGAVYGTVYGDANASGTLDAGESGLSGWRAYLDLNRDGSFTAGEPFALTDSAGRFRIAAAPGSYTVRVESQTGWRPTAPPDGSAGAFVPPGGAANGLFFGEAVTAGFSAVTSPRTTPVDDITITFGTLVTGFDLSDLRLTRDGQTVDLSGAGLDGSGSTYDLSGLSALTGQAGSYALILLPGGVSDATGHPLSLSGFLSWQMAPPLPVAYFLPVDPDPRTDPVDSVTLMLTEPVTGLAVGDFVLTQDGTAVGLGGATLSGSGLSYTLSGLGGLTGGLGSYVLTLLPGSAADALGNRLMGAAVLSWRVVEPVDKVLSTILPDPQPVTVPPPDVPPPADPGPVDPDLTPVAPDPSPYEPAPPPRPVRPPAPPTPELIAVGADAGGAPVVRLIDPGTGDVFKQFDAYDPDFTGGVRVAYADLTGDGVPDVVAAPGPGGGPRVRIFDGKTGLAVRDFFAYDPSFTGGVYLAVGDVNGDGTPDIVTGTGLGGGPHVKVFDGRTGDVLLQFMAYDPAVRTGVNVAAGDLDGDGAADIATGTGDGMGPHVRVISGRTGAELRSFFAYDPSFRGGVSVAIGAVTGGRPELIAAPGAGGGPDVRVFDGRSGDTVQEFFAYDPDFTGGVRVSAADADGDGVPDILTAPMSGGGPVVKAFAGATGDELGQVLAGDPSFRGGVFLGGPG